MVVCGESEIRVRNRYTESAIEKAKIWIDGLICVSTKSLEESISLNLLPSKAKTVVIPNAIDNTVFKKMDRTLMRDKLGLDQDAFIACFVGTFCHRKGVNRLIEAAKMIPGIKLVIIGSGDSIEDSSQIVFKGQLPHDDIASYLCASDIFVLPTLAEGCCNAIIEALACGLPVVSSNRSFNYDILNDQNSILVDPMSTVSICFCLHTMYA